MCCVATARPFLYYHLYLRRTSNIHNLALKEAEEDLLVSHIEGIILELVHPSDWHFLRRMNQLLSLSHPPSSGKQACSMSRKKRKKREMKMRPLAWLSCTGDG